MIEERSVPLIVFQNDCKKCVYRDWEGVCRHCPCLYSTKFTRLWEECGRRQCPYWYPKLAEKRMSLWKFLFIKVREPRPLY